MFDVSVPPDVPLSRNNGFIISHWEELEPPPVCKYFRSDVRGWVVYWSAVKEGGGLWLERTAAGTQREVVVGGGVWMGLERNGGRWHLSLIMCVCVGGGRGPA